jgi:competence ComEA-like helix-hairpin-helix protein
MKFLSFLHEKLGFTRNELKVILILGSTFLVGLGVRWYGKTFPPPQRGDVSRFDYTRSDSLFLARSRMLDSIRSDFPYVDSSQERRPTDPFLAGILDINRASKEELLLLPGIGEKYAQRIIRHRMEHGPFRNVDQLTAVRGIGPKTLERVRPFISAGQRSRVSEEPP